MLSVLFSRRKCNHHLSLWPNLQDCLIYTFSSEIHLSCIWKIYYFQEFDFSSANIFSLIYMHLRILFWFLLILSHNIIDDKSWPKTSLDPKDSYHECRLTEDWPLFSQPKTVYLSTCKRQFSNFCYPAKNFTTWYRYVSLLILAIQKGWMRRISDVAP